MENCQCGGTPGVHIDPFLFLLFINDIEVLNNIKMIADDTSLY
jgi:hypothetical protein